MLYGQHFDVDEDKDPLLFSLTGLKFHHSVHFIDFLAGNYLGGSEVNDQSSSNHHAQQQTKIRKQAIG